jgi:hypothetical protein
LDFSTLPDDALIRAPHVRQLFGGISQDTLERRVRAGLIPAPQKMPGSRINVWPVGPVRAALRQVAEAA